MRRRAASVIGALVLAFTLGACQLDELLYGTCYTRMAHDTLLWVVVGDDSLPMTGNYRQVCGPRDHRRTVYPP